MEPIDSDLAALQKLSKDIKSYGDTIITEEDTRMKVINRFLIEVLHWDHSSIQTESQAGSGYLDYALSISGRYRVIIEAKRDGKDFGLTAHASARPYDLDGPVFRKSEINEGLDQCIAYCGRKNAELACVTNGKEWVVFRGSRSGDGQDTRKGKGFIFSSIDEIEKNFGLFHNLLANDNVSQYKYRAIFNEAEGNRIRRSEFRKSLKDPNAPPIFSTPSTEMMADIEKVLMAFFQRVTADDDPEMLDKCFVVTRESQIAESKMLRIAENLVGKMRRLETESAEKLANLIEQARTSQRKEFIIIIGTKGAGKTTFIQRFFRWVLPKSISEKCAVIKIDLGNSKGDERTITSWLDEKLLEELERIAFAGQPEFDEIKGTFFNEYQRQRTVLKPLYNSDRTRFDIEFGKSIEALRKQDPHKYARQLLGNIVRSRRKIPCLIFDNTDHFSFSFQERVIQYARSIYENELCVIIVPITDRTSWQFTGHTTAESFENEVLYLPAPHPKKVIETRISFLSDKIKEEERGERKGYMLGKGLHITLSNLTSFAASLQKIFIETGHTGDIIKNLSNENIRNCLEITRDLAVSPYVDIPELIKAHIGKTSIVIAPHKIIQAIVNQRYSWYPFKKNKYIFNIFSSEDQEDTSPLLALRILALLADKSRDERDKYFEVQGMLDYIHAMGIERSVTTAWLDGLIKAKLCLCYDPIVESVYRADKIQLSPAGLQHLYWGMREMTYYQCMLPVTTITDSTTYMRLEEIQRRPRKEVWKEELEMFVNYLISEDLKYCKSPTSRSYDTQVRLPGLIEKALNRKIKASH